MKHAPVRMKRSVVLAWSTAFSLVAALGIASLTTRAETPLVPPTIRSNTLVQTTPVKRSSPNAQSAAAPPFPSQTSVIDSGEGYDVLRLRARGLTVPVSGVNAAQLSDSFTQSRSSGTTHEALDIMAPRGTPVLAVEDGRVTKLFLSKPGGITLYQFDPSAEFVYYYAHLDRYADGIVEGDIVTKGQVIGYVGSTGNASANAPHLHFAVSRLRAERQWWRGTAINPFLIWRDAKP